MALVAAGTPCTAFMHDVSMTLECCNLDESSIITSEQGQEANSAVPDQQGPFSFLAGCQALILQALSYQLAQLVGLDTAVWVACCLKFVCFIQPSPCQHRVHSPLDLWLGDTLVQAMPVRDKLCRST